MTLILLILGGLATARAAKIDCEDMLTPAASEVALRGTLRESTSSTNGPTWSVYDEALDEPTVIAVGDRVFLLDRSGKLVLAGGCFEYVRTTLGWNAGLGAKRIPLRRPRLRTSYGDFVSPEIVRIAIETRAPVVVFKACDEETRHRLAPENRRVVEIVGDFSVTLRPGDELISGDLRLTFDGEMRHAIDYTTLGYSPPRLHQSMTLGVGDERRGFPPAKNGDLVVLIDANENVLSQRRLTNVDHKIAAPFSREQVEWGEALARTRRVVIVRRK